MASAAGKEGLRRRICYQTLALRVFSFSSHFIALGLVLYACREAYLFRIHAITNFGRVIHEFDPWFNFRATEYLAENGWVAFFKWFDHTSWYPLGRPVGTTIYPGMQVAAVAIWRALKWTGHEMSLNDVCVFIPAWFGAASALFAGLLSRESSPSKSLAAMVAGAAVMAVIPAHLQRSVGGGFDNESVAMPCMCLCFYLWCRALRTAGSPVLGGALAGAAYACMAASWGGHIFALNVVGAHAGLLLLSSQNPLRVHRAYTSFIVVGTLAAMQVPVIGWSALRTLEHLGPLCVFALCQFLLLWRKSRRASLLAGAVCAAFLAVLVAQGFFGTLSARVLALFGHATRTGNPLVDSVAEHRPSEFSKYWRYLDRALYVALVGAAALSAWIVAGLLLCCDGSGAAPELGNGKGGSGVATGASATAGRKRAAGWDVSLFAITLASAAGFFSLRMSRLMILAGLPVAILCGIVCGEVTAWALRPVYDCRGRYSALVVRGAVVAFAAAYAIPEARHFYGAANNMARYSLSHPQIMRKASNGAVIDDYREAYWFLRDNTPPDSRVLAWWDYGYQISGIAKRTTLADGNTWNIEHIGLLGLSLTAPTNEAASIVRHLADYVLVWTGSGSNDLGKSTHMARISSTVFKGHCAERSCNTYGFSQGRATKMMKESFMYHLQGKGNKGGTFRDDNLFKEVYNSRNGLVRIVKVLNSDPESKRWAANPSNRDCDAPGSWYCPGNYPPKLRALFPPDSVHTPPFLQTGPAINPSLYKSEEARTFHSRFTERLRKQEAGLPKPSGDGIPAGTYIESCRGCRMQGGSILVCTHCLANGIVQESTLDISDCAIEKVDNIQGSLICTPMPNAQNCPKGGYLNSCQGCSVIDTKQGGTRHVVCTHCWTARGSTRRSEYALSRCPSPGALDNQNGSSYFLRILPDHSPL